MKLGLAQINTIVGDLAGNVSRCLDAASRVRDADLIILPEMTVPGYPPRDILYDESFIEATLAATEDLARRSAGLPPMLVGSLMRAEQQIYNHPSLHNVAYLLQDGRLQVIASKQLLPGYDVFYEPRWFLPGRPMPPVEIAKKKIGVLICEDLWDEEYPIHPAAELKRQGAEMYIVLAASPYRKGMLNERLDHARRAGLPLALVNLVGAADELIFDGRSFVLDSAQLAGFDEDIRITEFALTAPATTRKSSQPVSHHLADVEGELYRALVLGIRDFASKNGLDRAFVGLSGGIDSSVAAVIAAEALGAEQVMGIAIPSRYTDPRSTEAARELASALGIGLEVVDLERLHLAAEQVVGPERSGGVAGENLQARLRMMILMSFVNQRGGFLVNTSNKTELALGYSTLYGDMAGAISPLGDVTKPDVYALARWINSRYQREVGGHPLIPSFVMERKPSAELRPDQVDPFDYESLSPEIERMVLVNQSNAAMRASEHKRRQMGVVLKVSQKAFGTGRMVPITRR
ncbi:MAG: NAD(+) synthase [Anaerolineae bacterium]|nr:NAD(+) synthase [Anaerolineae bacterium]